MLAKIIVGWIQLSICFRSIFCQTTSKSTFLSGVTTFCDKFPYMTVNVLLLEPFYGVVHTEDHRTDFCEVFGNGDKNVTLKLNMIAEPNAIDDCGVVEDEMTGRRSVAIMIRQHKSLEMLEDRRIIVECNSTGYTNSINKRSVITMSFVGGGGQNTDKVIMGRTYALKVEQTNPDAKDQLQVRRCYISKGIGEEQVDITNDRGCPIDNSIMSAFNYDPNSGSAQAQIYSMMKLPGSSFMTINCMVSVCQPPNCAQNICDDLAVPLRMLGGAQLMISTTANVLEPTESMLPMLDCPVDYWMWLLGLCITFGVLFLVMLIVNILLCSALKCSCAKQEVIEREGSVIEDYDPYKGSTTDWGSIDGSSRFSLSSKHAYPMAESTIDYSTLEGPRYIDSRPRSRQSDHRSAGPI